MTCNPPARAAAMKASTRSQVALDSVSDSVWYRVSNSTSSRVLRCALRASATSLTGSAYCPYAVAPRSSNRTPSAHKPVPQTVTKLEGGGVGLGPGVEVGVGAGVATAVGAGLAGGFGAGVWMPFGTGCLSGCVCEGTRGDAVAWAALVLWGAPVSCWDDPTAVAL